MNQGDVHKVMVLNTFTAVTRVRICSVARWKEPSTYHELSYTPLVLQGVNSLISQEQQCGSTVPIRRESENNVDLAVRQDAALCRKDCTSHSCSQPVQFPAGISQICANFIYALQTHRVKVLHRYLQLCYPSAQVRGGAIAQENTQLLPKIFTPLPHCPRSWWKGTAFTSF